MDDHTPHPARQIVIPAAALLLPFVGFLAAVVPLWQRGIGPVDLGAARWGPTCSRAPASRSATTGCINRRSLMTHRWVAYALAALGSMAAFGPVIDSVADDRLDHAETDRDRRSPFPGRARARGRCAACGTRTSGG